ncbi:MAG: phenylpyruvate tautomerase MIF-related protein [Methylomonas sp.]|jgi:phenylpyruvate tautomerase PptA (4-oxalocrotonate tautomerase family)
MPYIKLNTNVEISSQQSQQLLAELSKLAVQQTGKPERYVMVEVNGGKAMLFGGDGSPLAFLECKSIGLSAAQAKGLAEALTQSLAAALTIRPDRIYIEFRNCDAQFWAWNGATFG